MGLRLKCHVRQLQSAIVSDVFAQGELTVDFYRIDSVVRRILPHETCCPRLVLLRGLARPPVPDIALAIELVAFVVEGMTQFMAHDRARQPKIHAVIHLRIKKWRLQDPCPKNNHVQWIVVVSLYALHQLVEFTPLYGLANLRYLAAEFKFLAAHDIAQGVATPDLQL